MAIRRKGRLPWRLGATSYVVPGDIVSNVQLLAPLVDDVQLLFFESRRNEQLPQLLDCPALQDLAADHDLTYTVHLPTDIRLGAAAPLVRQQGIDEILERIESLARLNPLCFDLHLRQEALPVGKWLDHLDHALNDLARRLGPARQLMAIENIDYPINLIAPLVRAHGFSFCLDFGHLKRYGHDQAEAFALLAEARHLHLHGATLDRDHLAVSVENDPGVGKLTSRLIDPDFHGVVTLEVYDLKQFTESTAFLAKAWALISDNDDINQS